MVILTETADAPESAINGVTASSLAGDRYGGKQSNYIAEINALVDRFEAYSCRTRSTHRRLRLWTTFSILSHVEHPQCIRPFLNSLKKLAWSRPSESSTRIIGHESCTRVCSACRDDGHSSCRHDPAQQEEVRQSNAPSYERNALA
jgi:hypothetical protein